MRHWKGKTVLVCALALLLGVAGGPAQAAWQIENIAPVVWPGVAPPALTFDPQDRPHVAYAVAPTVQWMVMHSYGVNPHGYSSGWTPPQTIGQIIGRTALLHVSATADATYVSLGYSGSTQNSTVLVNSGTGWQELWSTRSAVISGAAVAPDGQPEWIMSPGYPDATVPGFHLVRTDGSTLQTSLVQPNLSAAQDSTPLTFAVQLLADGDAVYDSAGNLHMVQSHNIGSASVFLMYARGTFGGPFVVDDNVEPGWWEKGGQASIAVDAAGTPHIAYTTFWPFYGVRYATLTEDGWVGQNVETGGSSVEGPLGVTPEILIGPDGTIHIVYADARHGLLRHARLAGDQWLTETIDTVGTYAAEGLVTGLMAAEMDSLGGIGVAYWDADDDMMKYAYLPVPEPATLLLLAMGAGALAVRRRVGGR